MLAYNPQLSKCQPTHENTFQRTWRQIINVDFLARKPRRSPPLHGSDKHPEVGEDQTPQPGVNYIRFHFVTKACVRFPTFTVEADPRGGPSVSFSLNPDSRLSSSQEGGKKGRKKTQTIWLPLLSAACVFRVATGIWMRRTAQLPEPCSETCMMSLRFHHYRLQMRLLWMGRVSSHACLAGISSCSYNVKKLLDKIKNGREWKNQKGWGSPS